MKNFVKGALLVALILPVVDVVEAIAEQLGSLINTWLAVQTIKIRKPYEKELNGEPSEPEHTYAMGFPLPDPVEEDEDMEEEEEDE